MLFICLTWNADYGFLFGVASFWIYFSEFILILSFFLWSIELKWNIIFWFWFCFPAAECDLFPLFYGCMLPWTGHYALHPFLKIDYSSLILGNYFYKLFARHSPLDAVILLLSLLYMYVKFFFVGLWYIFFWYWFTFSSVS